MSRSTARLARHAVLTTAVLGAAGFSAAPAHATQVDGELSRFAISDTSFAGLPPTNGPDVFGVSVATVGGQSVWKLVTESPIRAVSGTCTRISGQNGVAGPSEIHCRRGTEVGESVAQLGGGDDAVVVAPDFPDRLRLIGEDGSDTLTGGLANDVINGGDGDNVLTGNDGDDDIRLGSAERTQFADIPGGSNKISGGNGRDSLIGADGADVIDGGPGPDFLSGGRESDQLIGGEGDDSLLGGEDAFTRSDRLEGGPGTDRFAVDLTDLVFARDGVPEVITCQPRRFVAATGLVETDLKDTFNRGANFVPCPNVSNAPKDERPSAELTTASAKVAGRTARVRVKCVTSGACRGKLSLKLDRKGARAVSERYTVGGKRSRTVVLRLGAKDAAKVTRKGVAATATLSEKGVAGPRSVTRAMTAKR